MLKPIKIRIKMVFLFLVLAIASIFSPTFVALTLKSFNLNKDEKQN